MAGQVPGGKKSTGDAFQTTAAQWNEMVEAAAWVKANKGSTSLTAGRSREWSKRADIVKVKNVGTVDRSQFEIVGIQSSIFDPGVASGLMEFKREPSLQVRRPTCDHVSRFCVLLEPCNAGAIADAVISGVVQCKVLINDADDEFADIEPDVSIGLSSLSEGGSAQIIVRETPDSTGLMWCLVRLSNNLPFIHEACVSTSTTTPPTPTTPTTEEPTTPTTEEPTTPTTGTGTTEEPTTPTTEEPTTPTTGTGTTEEPTTPTTGTGTTGTGTTGTGTTEEPTTGTGTTGTTTGTTVTGTTGTTVTGTTASATPECPEFTCRGDCLVSFEVVTDVACVDGDIIVTKATLCLSSGVVDLPDATTGGA